MNPNYLEVTENNNFDSIKPIPIQIYVSTINLGTKKDPYSMFDRLGEAAIKIMQYATLRGEKLRQRIDISNPWIVCREMGRHQLTPGRSQILGSRYGESPGGKHQANKETVKSTR